MNLAEKFQTRCKSIIRMKHVSINSFCSWVDKSDSFLSKWQVLNTLQSGNPRILFMHELSRLLDLNLSKVLFSDDFSQVFQDAETGDNIDG